jgi:Holliday junction resolvase
MSKGKGDRREREAIEIYESAGYRCERSVQAHYGARSDFFGLFDIIAVGNGRLRLAQVKSNRASGIHDWCAEVAGLDLPPRVHADFLVCHDRAGWRLLQPDAGSYTTVVDERDGDARMGADVAAFLGE